MARFLSPKPLLLETELIILDEEQSVHIGRVLRKQTGDELSLIDGLGHIARGKIFSIKKHEVSVQLSSIAVQPKNAHAQLAFGLCKSSALDFIFHRCTEIGVQNFYPLMTDHAEHYSHWNFERWNKIVTESCKQCEELWFPVIHAPQSLEMFIKNTSLGWNLWVCDEATRIDKNSEEVGPQGIVGVVVGPTGGWSAKERILLDENITQRMSLGKNLLRAETACAVALAFANRLYSARS